MIQIMNIQWECWAKSGFIFVHYKTSEEALEKWETRKRRIDPDNLYIIGCEKDGCTYETIQRFDKLPYKNKAILTK